MRYLARTGFPSPSVLMVEIAMVGSARPMVGRSRSYSSSDMTSHVSRFCRPSYSSLYERSQMSLSFAVRRLCFVRDGSMRLFSPFALTCFAMTFDLARIIRAVSTVRLFFQPSNSFLLVTRDVARVSKSLRGIGLVLADFILPGLKYHVLSPFWWRYPCFGSHIMCGRNRVALAPPQIHGLMGNED